MDIEALRKEKTRYEKKSLCFEIMADNEDGEVTSIDGRNYGLQITSMGGR